MAYLITFFLSLWYRPWHTNIQLPYHGLNISRDTDLHSVHIGHTGKSVTDGDVTSQTEQ